MADKYLIFAIAALVIMAVVIYVLRRHSAGRDKYDFDRLNSGETPAANPDAAHEKSSKFMDNIGHALGIENFHELSAHVSALLKQGRREEAAKYLQENTPLERSRIDKILDLFEERSKE